MTMRWTPEMLQAYRDRQVAWNGPPLPVLTDVAPVRRRPRSDRLVLPYPPSTNHDKMPNGAGGWYLKPETKAFRRGVANVVAMLKLDPFVGDVRVDITLFPPGSGDTDNRVKPVLDALQSAGLFANDRQVAKVTCERLKRVREGEGSALVVVSTYEPEAA